MTPTVILLICISFAALMLGFYAWKLTSSRAIIVNTVLGSTGLLVSAYLFAKHFPEGNPKRQATFCIPLLVTMLFLGRALGMWWRSRKKEPELGRVALLLFAISGLSLVSAIVAFAA